MLARQIVTAFLAVIVPGTLLLGAVTLDALRSLGRISQQLARITQSLEATQELERTVGEAQRLIAEQAPSNDPRHRVEFDGLIRAAEAKISTCEASACHDASRTPAEMATLLRSGLAALRAEGHRLIDPAIPSVPPGPPAAETVHRTVSEVQAPLARMTRALLTRVEHLGAQSRAVSERALLTGAVLTGLIVLIGSVAALLCARRIARPVRELLDGIRRVMAGDLGHRVSVAEKGEFNEVGCAFNAMLDEVRAHREAHEEYSRRLEEHVQQRTEELKRKDVALAHSERLASLGLLAAGVAHELNNPLTSIVMNANLMAEDVGPGSALYGELKKIDADAARCRRIIDDLRAFARRRELCLVPSAIDAVVEHARRASEHELERRGIRVELDVPADLPKIVWDADRMVQVLTNLFVNAAQAMSAGGRLTVRCRPEAGSLRLEVEDTGEGIPEHHLSRIFDPFFTTKLDGTGLGLSIVHGIVHEHGGRIEVDSRTRSDVPDGATGTTVRIVVPWPEGPI